MALSPESGGENADRAREAKRIVVTMGLEDVAFQMRERDCAFVKGMSQHLHTYDLNTIVSPKQLFWLRDLKEKFL